MKKIVRKAFVALAFLGLGTGVTSCDTDITSLLADWYPVITQIYQAFFPTNSTPSQQFTGTFETECLCRTDTTDNKNWTYYNNSDATVKITSTNCNVTLYQASENNTSSIEVYLAIPTITIAGQTYTNLELYGGTFNTSDNTNGTFNSGEEFYRIAFDNIPSGSAVYFANISNGIISNGAISFTYQIVAGFNAYNGTYTGTLQQQ